jgi:hypothetical protein
MKPYAYRTDDFGKTWTPLLTGDGASTIRGYAHVARQDPVDANLLFLGTELGLWISLDGGKQWAQYKGGDIPSVAVRDLVVHPRDNSLVLATHGRGIWVVDDISPLRALTGETLAKEAAFVSGGKAVQRIAAFGGYGGGDATYEGPNPPADAQIVYYQKKRHIFGDLKIEIFDPDGKLVGTVPTSKRRGLSRAGWSMRLKGPRVPPAATASFGANIGPRVLPGTYKVRMTKDKQVYETTLEVVPDPRSKHTPEDRKAQFALATKLYGTLDDMTFAVDRINALRAALDERAAKLPAGDPLGDRLRKASADVDTIRRKIVATKEGGMITGEERLREYLTDLYTGVMFYEGRPSAAQVQRADALKRELADVVAEFDGWTGKELGGINDALAAKGQPKIELLQRSAWEKQGEEDAGGAGGGTASKKTERFERH